MFDDADVSYLCAYDGNLEHPHPRPLREMPGLSTPSRVLTAVCLRWSGADLRKPVEPVRELVSTSRSGDRRQMALRSLTPSDAPFVSRGEAEAVQDVHAAGVTLGRRHSHEAQQFILDGDGAYTLFGGDRGHRTTDQRPFLSTPSSAARWIRGE